jgi:hypothetical protein
MTSITVTVDLPREIEEKARHAGLLTGSRIAALIEAELQRLEEGSLTWGEQTVRLLQRMDLSAWQALDADDPVAWVDRIRREEDTNGIVYS